MEHRILFVDDDENILKIYKRRFANKYNIDLAKDAQIGLKLIEDKGQYSIAVADMRMPGMNGIEFLSKVKEIDPNIVRIILTGNADLEAALDAINKGNIFKFLIKPCKKKDFEHVLEISLKKYEDEIQLKKNSYTDPLTGLWNRRYLDIQANKIILSAKRHSTIFSIVFIDLNNFKTINDTLGHETGDKVLIFFSQVLKNICRKTDIIARFGGDEFIILIENEDKDSAIGLIFRLKKILLTEKSNIKNVNHISISAGVATYPHDSESIKKLIEIADKKMYLDKNSEKLKSDLNKNKIKQRSTYGKRNFRK